MAKKKMPFFRLSIIFIIIVLIAIFYSWGYSRDNASGSGMMPQSMGEMMGENHLSEITIRDLIIQEEDSQTVSEDTSQHHDSGSFLSIIHRITTITIVVLTPLIIAGTVFLLIIWFDKR